MSLAPVPSPVIETERLRLRKPGPQDAAVITDFYLTEKAQYAGGTDQRYKAWLLYAGEVGHWDIRGWGMFAVTEKGSDACIGLVGPFFPEGWPEKELGWLVFNGGEGRGIAYEAAVATRRYAYETLGWSGAVSYIHPANDRSIRLAERLGAKVDPDAIRPGGETPKECLVYRHPAPEAVQ